MFQGMVIHPWAYGHHIGLHKLQKKLRGQEFGRTIRGSGKNRRRENEGLDVIKKPFIQV